MPTQTQQSKALTKRLMPLYIAAFFQGFVLWYAIEKLFMRQIGFDDAGIGVMAAVYATTMLLVETPSGILADRWSRKGVLMLAGIALAVSSLVCGLSTEPMVYIAGAIAWGVFYALYSGMYDSIVYDTVIEETGKSEVFERYIGRVKIADSAALVMGALVGGAVGQATGLNTPFLWSIPLAVMAIIVLAWFKEPQLHKAEPLGGVKEHIAATFKAVLGRRSLLRAIFVLLLVTLTTEMLYEFSQLWLIATNTPPALFGPAFAIIISTGGIAGYLLQHIGRYRKRAVAAAYAVAIVSTLVLTMPVGFAALLTAQTLLGITVVMLAVLFMADVHNELPSRLRAGASSAVSTMGRLLLIPASLIFGFVSTHATVFMAAWMLVIILIIAVLCQFLPRQGRA